MSTEFDSFAGQFRIRVLQRGAALRQVHDREAGRVQQLARPVGVHATNTIKTHLTYLSAKANSRDRARLVTFAYESGLAS